ncbi:MAG TPA: ABC transporter permease [Candidatus Fermentibacter daniensis]|nr:ABC transporter permease [Candidatus Fermentibacter daniensis]HOR08069.1 ABC transporter permease [Candidatus Fermentibacter daniensis]HPK51661.1 ABC transporter permease [Candidatus Fermentibacter daniensis]HQE56339.1 ABC transporter permease [Candidatus Fermentibacter daniensis]
MKPGAEFSRRTLQLAFGLFLIAAWIVLGEAGVWPAYIFPTLGGVLRAIARTSGTGALWISILGSMKRLLLGYAVAMASGVVLGVLLGSFKWARDTIGQVVLGLQALPSICWLPPAILWFGLSEQAILFVVIMGAFLSISLATQDGIRNTPRIYLQAARNLGASGLSLYTRVVLPASLPSIVTGMKLGWTFAWRSLMAGELLYSVPGLGSMLALGRELNDMNQVVAVMLVIVAIGLMTDKLAFGAVEKAVRSRWGTGGGRR